MTDKVTITYQDDGDAVKETIESPEFIDVLVNVGEAAIDGETYTDVTEVKMIHD